MKLLIIDQDGVGLAWAWRAAQAGHEVKLFMADKPTISKEIGEGFKGVTKVNNFIPHMMWADVIMPTSNDLFVERMDFFRKKGARVFGPTVASANLEISRKTGMELMKKKGIEVAPYKVFKNMKEAAKHIEKTKERFCFKTMGDNADKALTYVSKDAADLLDWIDRIIERKQEPEGEVMLQSFIKGIEIGVSRFMGKDGFVGPWNESWEHKKVMSGNFGPNCGEAGTIAAFMDESKLAKETLAKFEDELVSLGHTGDVAMGFMVPEDGVPRPTEWTCRGGWPFANLALAAIEGDPVTWMSDALDGKDTTTFKKDVGCCVVVTHGDFPHGNMKPDELTGVPIMGVTKSNKKYIQPQHVKIEMKRGMDGGEIAVRPTWVTTGDYIAVVTGFGETVKQATDRTYKTVSQLHVSNMGARDDIGEALKESIPKMQKLGYAENFKYE